MIISDRHRFVFVHIPKCAGSMVRDAIDALHDQVNVFEFFHEHPRFGRIDLTHVPLEPLRRHFPIAFARTVDYSSHAILRDPRPRFVSCLAQHLRKIGKADLPGMSERAADREVDRTIERLRSGEQPWTDPLFVHFQRQVDFVSLDGEQIVDRLHAIERLQDFFDEVQARTGFAPRVASSEKRNVMQVHEDAAGRSFGEDEYSAARSVLRRVMPQKTRLALKNRFFRVAVHPGVDSIYRRREVAEFLDEYYEADAKLHASVRDRPQSIAEQRSPHGAPADEPLSVRTGEIG